MNLQRKIALYVGGLVLVVCLSLAGYANKTSSDALVAEIEQALYMLAEEGVHYTEAVIRQRYVSLEELARREAVFTMDWEQQQRSLIRDVSRLGFMDMAVVTPDGTAHYVLSADTAQLGDREYVKKAFAGETNVSDVIISRVTNSSVLMYATPIRLGGGDGSPVVGVLLGRRSGDTLSDITDQMGFGKIGICFLFSHTIS